MDSKEDILEALDEFNHKNVDKLPPLLERYLNRIAATGETLFAWPKLRPLFIHKLDLAMKEFFEKVPTDDLPTCPNVENVKFDEMRQRLLMSINEFNGAPFTIQRLCELITNPQKHYKRTDKFMRGIEKNLLVVSTVDPYGNKIVNESSKIMVNGLDANGYETDKISPDTPERSFFPPPAPSSSPNTNGTGSHGAGDASTCATSSPTSSWFTSSSISNTASASSSSSTDTVCPWGIDSSTSLLERPTVEGEGLSRPLDTGTPAGPLESTSNTSPQLEPIVNVVGHTTKEAEISESSSESSGSSSSTTPPHGDIDKDSGDSNESAETSESSSSEGSVNEVEAESHVQPPQPVLEAIQPAEESAARTSLEPQSEGVSTLENEDCSGQGGLSGELRESAKRTIEQNHTETQNKRLRMDKNVAESSCPATVDESTVSVNAPTDKQIDSSIARDKRSPEEEDQVQTDEESAEVQTGRDSQDSLGFDLSITSDAEVAATEDTTTLKQEESEGAKPPSVEDGKSKITTSSEGSPVTSQEEVTTADQTSRLSECTLQDDSNEGSQTNEHEQPSSESEPCDQDQGLTSKTTNTDEAQSKNQSESSSPKRQSDDISQSSLQTEESMVVN